MNINKQIFIVAVMAVMAVMVPAVETEFAQASVNNLDNCWSNGGGPGGWGWDKCGGTGGWGGG